MNPNNGYNENEADLLIKSIEETIRRAEKYLNATEHLKSKDRKELPHTEVLQALWKIRMLYEKIRWAYLKGQI